MYAPPDQVRSPARPPEFQIPGSLAARDNVAISLQVQNAASIRCVYAYLQQRTSDGQSAYVMKYSTDGGTIWNVLEKMGIAQNIGTPFKNTWDFLVAQGYGKPETRRLPYDDYGLMTTAPITGNGVAQRFAQCHGRPFESGRPVRRFELPRRMSGCSSCFL